MAHYPGWRPSPFFAAALLSAIPLFPQARVVAQAPEFAAAAIPMAEEHHHHLVLENSYVRAYFVEIQGHESTLLHRHDFPYVNVPPSGVDAPTGDPNAGLADDGSRISYTLGGFSHVVSNPGDVVRRSIAIELIRPQGTIRNRCREVVKDQPREDCDMPPVAVSALPKHYALFETDEILAEYWELSPNSTASLPEDRLDTLVAGLTNVSVTADSRTDSANAPHGILWLPAGSKPIFKTPAASGHFVAITFKDSSSSATNRSPSEP
jgi:hypothetical protein